MRKHDTLALLAAALFLAACGERAEKQPAAATSPTAANLDIAPRTYTRMQSVSELEQSKSSVAMKSHVYSLHVTKASHTTSAPDPIASLAAQQLTVTATAEALPPQQPIVLESMGAPSVEMTAASMPDSYVDHSAEGDGLLAGPSTRVVIRGGVVGGEHKCDPRSEAQARGQLAGRPNSSMPLAPRSAMFGGRTR